jgi:hypothetical protein
LPAMKLSDHSLLVPLAPAWYYTFCPLIQDCPRTCSFNESLISQGRIAILIIWLPVVHTANIVPNC